MTRDFTTGNPTSLMLRFAVPIVLSSILQNLYNTVDMVIVGRYIGEEALAAVGATHGLTMFILMFIGGATMGMSVVLSQFHGAKDIEMVKKTMASSIYLILLLSIIFSVVGVVFSRNLLQLIRVPHNVMEDAARYLSLMFAGSTATAFYNMAASVSRALGDSITPMIMLVISSVLNIGLNVLFVTRFGMGVEGVAYATMIATAVSAAVCLAIVWHKMPVIHPTRETAKPDAGVIKMVTRIGLPSALQNSMMAVGHLSIQTLVNGFGSTVMASYSAATKVEALMTYGSGGITQAMQFFAGQNVGAGRFDRVRQGFRDALKAVIVYCVAAGVLMILFGRQLIGVFTTPGSEMIGIGYTYLVISGIGITLCGIIFLTRCTLLGAGDSMAAVYISAFDLGFRVLGAFILSRYFGYVGVFLGLIVGWTVACAFGCVRYVRGKWVNMALTGAGAQSRNSHVTAST